METRPTSFRLSEECREILRRWAERLGVSDANVIEMWARVFDRTGMEVSADFVRVRASMDERQAAPGKRGRGRPPRGSGQT
jgi:hypothetical protein